MSNVICEMLGIKYPIFQGAMAWVSDSSLAAAVSNAGGLGIIAGANAPAEHIRNEIRLETNFVDDLGADSLDLFQVVMELEDALDAKVEEVDGLKIVADAVKYIETVTQK